MAQSFGAPRGLGKSGRPPIFLGLALALFAMACDSRSSQGYPDASATPDGPPADAPPSDGPNPSDARVPDATPPDGPPASGPLRVGTINLHCLFDSPDVRFQGVATEAMNRGLDALAVQEACQNLNGSGNAAAALASKLTTLTGRPWEYHWAETHLAWNNTYDEGVGIVAPTGSITERGALDLPYEDGLRRRAAWGRIETDHGGFYLYSAHFSISSDDQDRVREAQTVLGLVGQHLASGRPQVVCGDFNATPNQPAVPAMLAGPPTFVDSWARMHPDQPGYTVEQPNPSKRIDYIFIDDASLGQLIQVELSFGQPFQGVMLSDHIGVTAGFVARAR
jgi:endonuclease/exonuclease/phosphatase family metal-dependent hydrolase